MCRICDQWSGRKVTAEEAMNLIGLEILSSPKDSTHLQTLASTILDDEVPMTEADADADHAWWAKHHPVADQD